jgi:hypothetical protein
MLPFSPGTIRRSFPERPETLRNSDVGVGLVWVMIWVEDRIVPPGCEVADGNTASVAWELPNVQAEHTSRNSVSNRSLFTGVDYNE